MGDVRILIVEDDILIGELLSMMLEDMGHAVCGIATTEDEAVAIASAKRPDLMICDMKLDQGTGPGAVATIAKATGFVPHIYVSGNINSVLAAAPDSIVVEKPFRQEQLQRAIGRALTEQKMN
jgi:CheY-like chemotaxis protein